MLGLQCNSSCDPAGDDVIICNFTCNTDYNLTNIDIRMCQDGDGTANETICIIIRSKFVSILKHGMKNSFLHT